MNSNEKRQVTVSANHITATYAGGGEYMVISLKGRMVYETSDEFSQELVKQIKEKGQYLIDVNDLEKIDSTGLGVLITFSKKVQAVKGEVAFVVHKEFLKEIFKIAKFDYIFPVANSRDEAWEALKSGYQSKMALSSY